MTYTLTNGSSVIRDEDGACIPDDPANIDWQTYQEWLAAGNVPNPYIPPLPPVPQQVPMWTVRTVLQNDGLFDQINTIIAGSTDQALKNVWEYGNFADRNSVAINTIAYTLGLTEKQVDQMFIDANNLSV